MKISVKDILKAFPPVRYSGNDNALVEHVIQLDPANTDDKILTWCNSKNVSKLTGLKYGTVIIPAIADLPLLNESCNYIAVENPRQYFNEVLTKFFWVQETELGISESAEVAESAKLGANVFIGPQVVIKENCIIGDNVRILQNTVLHPNTIIENNVNIGANNVIGNYGFGYEKNRDGRFVLMPHLGNVVIRSGAEIGNNNCIDRAVLGSTVIGGHSKIHNFVQVAHGVEIGENCLVTANVTVSGSTFIGNDVWIGPGVTISNKLKIGDSAYLSIGAVILSDVPPGATVVGNPGRIVKTPQKQ